MLFTETNLAPEILRAVEDMGFTEMTEIQEKAIPVMLSGEDIIGRSNTGTGKTAAFALPAIQMTERDEKKVSVLILCPTRELAMQACEEIVKFSKYMPWIKPCAVYGGASMDRQISELRHGANIVIGTPGRVMDHIRRKTLRTGNVRIAVLDEADEMLNMGFREDIEEILSYIPEERQTVLFSATMPPAILAVTDRFQRDPVLVRVENKTRTVESIDQFYFEVPAGRKTDALKLLLLAYEPRLSMIFCNTKKMVDELCEDLVSSGFRAAGLHGDMKQQSRTQVLSAFRSGRLNILIATDVAARGIDVDDVDAVFNYDIPQDIEYYIHRIGRTGRAGKSGAAYTLACGRRQYYELKEIARSTKAEIVRKDLPDRNDIIARKTANVSEKIKSAADSGKYDEFRGVLLGLTESGYSAEDIAAALLGMKLSKEIRNIPEFAGSLPERRSAGRKQRLVKLELSVGRKHKIAPNFIVSALAEYTGIPGKEFGKIDISDSFTTVEVPEKDRDHIIAVMMGKKINGHKVTAMPAVDIRSSRGGRDRGRDRGRSYPAGRRQNDRRGYSNKNRRHQ